MPPSKKVCVRADIQLHTLPCQAVTTMKTISDLPDELILHVLDEVHPDDIESFSQTCKHIHACSRGHLEKHRNFKAQYSEVVLRWKEPKSDDHAYHFQHPMFLLEKIWNEPVVAHYIKMLEFVGVNMGIYQADREQTITERIKTSSTSFRDAKASLLDLLHPVASEWLEQLRSGDRGVCFNTLFLSLSSLQRLRINYDLDEVHVEYYFDEVAGSLPHLHTIEIYAATGKPVDIEYFTDFMFLPNIRHLKGLEIDGAAFDRLYPPIILGRHPDEYSNVESIEITEGFGDLALLWALKDRFVHLEHFRFSFAKGSLPHYARPDVFNLVRKLSEAFGGRLKSLSLIGSGDRVDKKYTFSDFKVLQELEIDVISLSRRSWVGRPEPAAQLTPKLVYILPPSLESLLVNVGPHEDVAELLFREFAKQWKGYLPNLHTVTLAGIAENRLKDLEAALTAAGLQVEREAFPYIPKHDRFWLEHPGRNRDRT